MDLYIEEKCNIKKRGEKKLKKLFMFLMAAFLLIGIAACGGEATTETPTTEAPTTQAPTTQAPTTQAPTTQAPTTQAPTTEDVFPEEASYPSGLINYKFQTSDIRHTFMAAAEKFLLNNMYGGVPLFANGGFALYSSRLQLPVDSFVPVMGWGTSFATMSADDSTVLMADGEYGEVGEYTYRTTSTTNPVTFNQWLYDTSTDADYMGLYYDTPYTYHFNEEKTGYEVVPSMMSSNPIPVGSEFTDTGKEISKTWQFEVKEGLEWFFHPDTDTSYITDTVIDANDFVETYKYALAENWFRAVSGGGDFINSASSIEGAAAFNADPTEENWANVGINLIDDNTFEFVFENSQSEWNVRYFMGSMVMSPVQLEMVEELGDRFGTDNLTVAYHGAYYVDYYEADKTVVFAKNPNYHTPDEYFYTGYEWQIINDAAIRFQEFEAGKLEAVSLPTENYDDYKNHPGLKRIPGATTFRMMINGLGTVEAQQEQFPGSTWVPEPILANDDFKMALFFAIDRKYLAETVLKTSQTQMYLFTDAYLVEAEEGIPYRQTPQGKTVGEGLAPGSNGYNKDAAIAYWELAIEALVDDGTYDEGDTIELDFFIFSGSEAQSLLGQYIKTTFEETFTHADLDIDVVINVEPKDFPGIYYDYMMTGMFDLSIGGISGSALDAASFLDVFADDNRGGFTLNWGVNTSDAVIPVKYTENVYNDQGEITDTIYKYEMWSYNAIVSVLNGDKFIQQGAEANVPQATFVDITPTSIDMTISELDNTSYDTVTVTVQEYSQTDGVYYDVAAHTDVDATAGTMTFDGLQPYPYDYQVVVSFRLVGETDDEGEDIYLTSTSTWNYTDSLIADYPNDYSDEDLAGTPMIVETVTHNTYELDVTFNNEDRATGEERTIDDVIVYDANGDEFALATFTIDGTTVTVEGLSAGSDYSVELVTDDAFTNEYVVYYNLTFEFSTDALVDEVTETTTITGATFDFSLLADEDDVARTVSYANVYDMTGVLVAGATAAVDEDIVTVTGLVPNTSYGLWIESNDGIMKYMTFTTESMLVNKDVTVAADGAMIMLTLDEFETQKTISSVVIEDADGVVFNQTFNGTFKFTTISFAVLGLVNGTDYTMTVTTSDNIVETVEFSTTDILANAETLNLTHESATVHLVFGEFLNDEVVTIELMDDATLVGTLDLTMMNYTSGEFTLELDSLDADTEYTIVVTTAGGLTEEFTFTTEEAPVAAE
jgi:ABC-type oligopeptide transport system substrate-binding subunit